MAGKFKPGALHENATFFFMEDGLMKQGKRCVRTCGVDLAVFIVSYFHVVPAHAQ